MPTYCFTTKDDESVELTMTVAEMEAMKMSDDEFMLPDGRSAVMDMFAMHSGHKHRPDLWLNHASESCGVAPDQVKEKMEENARRGVHVEYTPDGRAKFTSMNHRRKYMKAYGLHDKSAYM